MRAQETTLMQKGQVTIPQEIRTRLGLKPRDRVIFELEGETARLRKAPSKVLRWYGAVTPPERPEDFRQAREEFESGVADEAAAEELGSVAGTPTSTGPPA